MMHVIWKEKEKLNNGFYNYFKKAKEVIKLTALYHDLPIELELIIDVFSSRRILCTQMLNHIISFKVFVNTHAQVMLLVNNSKVNIERVNVLPF